MRAKSDDNNGAQNRGHDHSGAGIRLPNVRYPLTLGFGLATIVIAIVSSQLLIARITEGAHEQLIRTLQNEISRDLTREIDNLRDPDEVTSLDGLVEGGRIESWFEDISRDVGGSVGALVDPDLTTVWTNNPPQSEYQDDHDHDDLLVALSGKTGAKLALKHRLQDGQGDYYFTTAIEVFLPIFSDSGEAVIGVLEIYVDVEDQLTAAGAAARSNVLNASARITTIAVTIVFVFIFIVELALKRLHGRRREEAAARSESEARLRIMQSKAFESEVAAGERERFLAVVSHELKTPLTSVLAFADLLAGSNDGSFTERQSKHLDLVRRNARRLDLLIDDVLDVSRIETGRLSCMMTESSVLELFDDLKLSLTNLFLAKKQKLVTETPAEDVSLLCDRSRIFQAISNLLSNASKYSPENSTINLRAVVESEWLRVSVSDEGPGLTERQQGQVFNMFYRVDNETTRSVAGLGVGLAVVKAIVELHNGTLSVDSSPGAGAVFSISIPVVVSQSRQLTPSAAD